MKKIILFTLLVLSLSLSLSSCGEEPSEYKGAHIHNFGAWERVTLANCTTAGEENRFCACGEVQKREIPASGHTYSELKIIEEAKCDRQGTKERKCTICGNAQTEVYSLKVYSANEIFEYASDSVAEIVTYDKSGYEYALGSGFVYTRDGRIITNYHVIEGGYSAQVNINGSKYTVTEVLAYDKDIDIAVLKINASDLPTLPICKRDVRTGAAVYAFGSSKGFTATISDGIVTHAKREEDGVTYVQHNAAISSGNSGGPLINEYGEIIGINTFTIKDSQNLNFAIFTTELDNLSYNTPLTMKEFYEKECDPLLKIASYIAEYGTYDSDGYYYITRSSYVDDIYLFRRIDYNYFDGTICFNLLVDNSYMVSITIDKVDGSYDWVYYDQYDDWMDGIIYANTYDENTLLGISNYDSYSTVENYREFASVLVSTLCSYITSDLQNIGVTAYDLGFYCYY